MGPGSNIAGAQPVDSSILHEIVRVVESRRKVPERVQVRAREYLITYLEDHQRRLEEALQRYDSDRLNMLYGQLASKIKYQLLRRLPGGMARQQAKEKKPAPPQPKVKPKKVKPKPKVKPKAKATPKPKKRPTAKAKPKAKAGKKGAQAKRGAAARARGAKQKSVRVKTGKPAKRVAARKATPVRAGKRGNKRKPAKK